jgi:hypothetical protein
MEEVPLTATNTTTPPRPTRRSPMAPAHYLGRPARLSTDAIDPRRRKVIKDSWPHSA